MAYLLQNDFWFIFAVYVVFLPLLGGTVNRDGQINAINEKREAAQLPNDGELFEGDIMMDARFRRIVRTAEAKKSALTYGGLYDVRWPNGVVVYEEDHTFSLWSRLMLAKAIYQIERRTCVRFKKHTNEYDYVVFTSKKDGCYSYVGRLGGQQVINLEKECVRLGTFEHEIMHVLGIIHEHSRPDRDRYIKVKYENVDTEDLNNFQKYPYFETDDLNEEFNFNSVMLYPNDAFSKNGRDTIEAVNEPGLHFGQRKQFSIGDIHEINKLYACNDHLKNPDYDGLVKNYHIGASKKKYNLGFFEQFMEWLAWMLEDVTLIFVF